jgi:hypothetical protein
MILSREAEKIFDKIKHLFPKILWNQAKNETSSNQ